MPRVVTVTANPLLNYITDQAVEAGAVNRVPRLVEAAEGKGINVARVLHRFGHRVTCCGFAGGHSGAAFTQLLAEDDLDPRLTPTAARLRVGVMAAPVTSEHPTTILEHGFAVTPAEADALLAEVTACLDDCALVIVSGSVPEAAVADLYPRIVDACQQRDIPCWVDSYGAGMAATLAGDASAALAKPNREEEASCSGWERVGELHITAGGGRVAISRDAERWSLTPPEVRQVNPVGSGDCYLAGLAHARLTGLDWETQLRLAAAAGAANAARADIAKIELAEVEALASRAEIGLG